ncbi:hypothetical protein L249_4388 [Ophiocordyceps polyrhachis-furcata BCC 54312]|uniref:G-protein coupled receptors family 2 profile 2 domain-containing protein n=1 Tax=Ophiocordyceps polyrhachis-furcata BCC 54312 TaxID=1330021 RepID=A0A367L847_9HYPO|nr:hypothetical protein L249_4388 [Ophiocordyceps polyrhachis-furcata BCC 54312]
MALLSAVGSMPTPERLTPGQVQVLVALERVGGSVSLVALMFIFIAYALLRPVRNVQNTFIVFASVSNVGASVASIIALDGIKAGTQTPLCQTQSFLFEMFMQSDPWWSLAMAVNVFLVFYYRTSPDSFRRWWWVYCLICYGGPFIIALTLLLIKSKERGPVYGQATVRRRSCPPVKQPAEPKQIWCWVDSKWDAIRIFTYYMLIWICIIGSFICYILVGYHVFRSRNRLRSFPASKNREASQYDRSGMDHIDSYCGTRTTEVQVVHSSASVRRTNTLPEPKQAHASRNGEATLESVSSVERRPAVAAQNFSTVTSATPRHSKFMLPLTQTVREGRRFASKFVVDDPIKRAYLRTSLLFALSVLVTWIPSSLNRIHGWLAGESPFEFHVATAAVLPLQGVWNCFIFFVTSWKTVKRCIRGVPSEPSHSARGGESMGTVDRTCARHRDDVRSDTDFSDGESGNMGSDVELRQVSDRKDKETSSV